MSRITDSKYALLAGASALVFGVFGPVAVAQEDVAEEAASSEDSRRLSTVTVTAQQRVESIQDVPIAITALSTEDLERAGVADIKGLDQVAPSFNMNTSDTESGGITLRLRGVGTTGNNIGLESSVGVFLDGVYLSRPGVALADLLDVEQLEVLRGPQGTLFGRNTSAGALNIKTKRPNLDEFSAFGNATFGNYGLINVQGGFNAPVVEDFLAIRVSGATRKQDGFLSGLNGSESGSRDRITLRGQALMDFKDAGDLRLIVDYADGEDACCDAVWFNEAATVGAFGPAGLGANGGAPNVGPSALEGGDTNSENFLNPFEQTGYSAEYNVETGLGKLTYVGSYRDYFSTSYRNTDYTGLRIFTVGNSPEAIALGGQNYDPNGGSTIETTTHELRLQNTAFDGRLDWLLGAYYSDEQIDSQGSLTLLDQYQRGVSAGQLGSPANLLLAFAGGASATGDFATNRFTQSGESMSLFTHNVFDVTDKLSLTVGLRYVEESKDGKFEQLDGQHNACLGTFANVANIPAFLAPGVSGPGTAVALNCFVFAAPVYDPANPGPLFGAIAASPAAGLLNLLPREFDDTFEDEELVYTVKASYKINSTTNIFGGYTTGFKSGGFNLDASAANGGADPRFDSEKINALEFGLKTDFWDGRARANIAVFEQKMEDFQVLEFTGIQFQTFNVDKAESRGAEIELLGQLTDHFTGTLGVTYADAFYPDDCAPATLATSGALAQAYNLCGAKLTNAPEWVTIVGGTYERLIEDGRMNFFVTGSIRNETERRTSTQPTVVATNIPLRGDIQEGNTKANLRIGFEAPDESWGIELWGNNITDERTKNVTFSIPLRGAGANAARGQFTQEPATYGITLRTRF
jgi:outer membrane receptor protein involved in Fe transport